MIVLCLHMPCDAMATMCSGGFTSNNSGGDLLQVSTYAVSFDACSAEKLVHIPYCCCNTHHATSHSTPVHYLINFAELLIMKGPVHGTP